MKRFIEWLKPDSRQHSAAKESGQAPVSVRAGREEATEDEHSDASSVSWFGIDQADSSVFDTGSLSIEKSDGGKGMSHRPLALNDDSSCGAEEDNGFDPYNSGRFETGNE